MNKPTRIGLIVLLTALAFVGGYFVDRHRTRNNDKDTALEALLQAELQAAQAKVADFANETRPKLWVDEDAAKVIRQLGYDHVWLFRWQNGILDGWVEFDEPGGPKRFPLDTSRRTFDQWSREGLKPVARGSKGTILLTLRQIGKSDEFECELTADYRVHREDGGGAGQEYSKKGKVKLELHQLTKHSASRFGMIGSPGFRPPFEAGVGRYVNEKEIPWVNIKLVELPK